MADDYAIVFKGITALSKTIPDWLEEQELKFLDGVGSRLATNIIAKSPKHKIPFLSRRLKKTITISSVHPGAKALDRGAYITPKKGDALKFASGRFAKRARLPARKYVRAGLRGKSKIISDEYTKTFGQPKEFKE